MSSSYTTTGPLPPVQDSLSDSEFMKLSERLKPLTWLIKVCYTENSIPLVSYATGFAIKVDRNFFGMSIEENDLLLMTCAHYFPKSNYSIKVRRFEDKSFTLEAQPQFMRRIWDIALLVVKGAANSENGAEFANDGSITDGQTLVQVGHSKNLVWSTFVGRAGYHCVNDFTALKSGKTCGNYCCDSLDTTPNYRIMGNIWNKAYFDQHQIEKFEFEKNLHPLIPIIQCNGFMCKMGCSGGPVFNTQGQIVGMVVGKFDGCLTAIHVGLLKEFLKVYSDMVQGHSEVDEQGDRGGGKDASRPLKRKKQRGV